MKQLLLGLALSFVCLSANADKAKETIWVFGDSLTAPYNSWAEIIDDLGYAQMRNTARGGLRMVDVTMPDWLLCFNHWGRDQSKVIIWLGGNDGLQQINVGWYKRKLTDHLQFLEGRGCNVFLALPPSLEGGPHEDKMTPYRIAAEEVAVNYDNVTILDIPHPIEHLPDGIHQTEGLMFWQAVYVVQQLGLTPPADEE